MNKIKPISLFSTILVAMMILCGNTSAADRSPAPQEGAKSGVPGAGGPGSGEATASSELSAKYSLEILAPANIPVKTLYINDPKGNISAAMDSEHGTQSLTNVSFDGTTLKFTALLGSNGDESFNFTLKCYGSVLLGESEADKGPSPVVAKAVE